MSAINEYNEWKKQFFATVEVDGELFYVREGIRHTEEQLQHDWSLVNRKVPKPGEDPVLDQALAAWIGAFSAQIQPMSIESLDNPEKLQERRENFHRELIDHGHTEEAADMLSEIALENFVSIIRSRVS